MQVHARDAERIYALLEQCMEDREPLPVRSSTAWERERREVARRLSKLSRHLSEAAAALHRPRRTGRPSKLSLSQRAHLLLLAIMTEKSNRDMEAMLGLFAPVCGVSVSYKTIERLYGDEAVRLVLCNALALQLREQGCSGELAGDGTGYSLAVKHHYASNPEKRNRAYRYSFRLLDVESGLYVAYGYSSRSEMDAYRKAMAMARELGIGMRSIRLDKYYSARSVLSALGGATPYVLPKRRRARFGPEWSRVYRRILADPYDYLKEYYKRNLCETMYACDKGRFGRTIRQRREDRQEMAMAGIAILHNVFTTRVPR